MKIKSIFAIVMIVAIMSLGMTITTFAATEEKDYTIESCWWDEPEGKIVARWEKPESSTSFKVTLFRRSSDGSTPKKIKTENASGTSKDFTSLITKNGKGIYTFIVNPVKAPEGYAVASEDIEIDSDYINELKKKESSSKESIDTTQSGGPGSITTSYKWSKDGSGNWHLEKDGVLVKNRWERVSGYWYLFDVSGNMRKDWCIDVDGKWYYLEPTGNNNYPEGACWINTTTPDGFRVGTDGAWIN